MLMTKPNKHPNLVLFIENKSDAANLSIIFKNHKKRR